MQYDVMRGRISELRVDGGVPGSRLPVEQRAATSLLDPGLPLAGDSFYHLVRGQNPCGTGGYLGLGRRLRIMTADCP